jgi:hypothetical protein
MCHSCSLRDAPASTEQSTTQRPVLEFMADKSCCETLIVMPFDPEQYLEATTRASDPGAAAAAPPPSKARSRSRERERRARSSSRERGRDRDRDRDSRDHDRGRDGRHVNP